ncbi:MAG: family 43 glycosylhydrolase, partial [Phycisphaerales bacterium]|nr:family 43 glycosylhydrolase [Phycisphaerales bacterium]
RDERMGWMADTQVFVPTAAYNADIAPFMTKWMRDVRDAQREDGAHADVAPVMRGLNYGTPAWGDAGTIVPWAVYQFTGDTRMLAENIGSMRRWVDWCAAHSTDLIRDRDRGNDYGDWLSIDAQTPKDLIGTAYFARSAWIVARASEVLGEEADAARYQALFDAIREAFRARYVSEGGRVLGDTQTGDLLALGFDLLTEAEREATGDRLLSDLRRRGWRLSTGFVGVSLLLPVLDEMERPDVAYRLLLQDAFPSWLFSVRHGATTIWERWNGWTPGGGMNDPGMNSFNHYALGSCGEWLFSGVAGIRPDDAAPGFAHFYVRPRIDGPLESAAATYRSVRGTIGSAWTLEGDDLRLEVTVPANTRATVTIPARQGGVVLESGRELGKAEGVRSVQHAGEAVQVEVGSGRYVFTSMAPAFRPGNPVFPGWYADPEVALFEGQVWVYPTYSAPYDEQLHFDAFSSPDLVRWTKHERVLEAADVSWARRAMWAPSIIEREGRYYLFFGANDIQNDEEVGGIGVAVAERPEGPFKDLLGRPLIDAFHNGAQPIDQFVFRDEDGTEYLIYGGWGHCNIARLRDDYRALVPFE